MAWRIEFHPRAEKELSELDREAARKIVRFLRERVAPLKDPRSPGETLKGSELLLLEVPRGDYRLICYIQEQRVTI